MARVLFVDDEVNVLRGLKRTFRGETSRWDSEFTENPEEALQILANDATFDVVISDIQMPGMSGVELLSHIRDKYPRIIRVALSGHTDHETMLRASTICHQLLSKPCDPDRLRNTVNRALLLREHLKDSGVREKLLEIGSVPSPPALYSQIMDAVTSEDASVADVAEIIEQDAGVSVKVLQLVNSAYMGLRQSVSDIVQATTFLGLDTIRDLVLMTELFQIAPSGQLPSGFSLDVLWHHSVGVASNARRIAEVEGASREIAAQAFTAGLIHDIGFLILAAKMPTELDTAYETAKREHIPLEKAEARILGVTHAQAGGFLLEVWGLPDPIVEAVTYHLYPSASPDQPYGDSDLDGFHPVTAVHVANYFRADHQWESPAIDTVYLNRLNLTPKLDDWWNVCEEESARS